MSEQEMNVVGTDLPEVSVNANERRGEEGGDAISAWLDLFARMLQFPERECVSIRLELEGHLRERVRDLMLAGRAEDEAMRGAIGEFGESALLARRFHATERRFRKRRTLMNIMMFGAAGVVVAAASTVTSVSIISNGNGSNHVASYVELVEGGPNVDGLDDLMVDLHFADVSSADVLEYLASEAELELLVKHGFFDGFTADSQLTMHTPKLPFASVMRRFLDVIGQDEVLTWRVDAGILEVATQVEFDQREMLLATYDLSAAVEVLLDEFGDPETARDEILDLLRSSIEPEGWEVNGGMTGSLQLVGNQMFVKAPPRYLPGISWLLGELERGDEPVEPVTQTPVGALEGGDGP